MLKRLRSHGVSVKAGRRLLVLRDGSRAITAEVRMLWPDALQ